MSARTTPRRRLIVKLRRGWWPCQRCVDRQRQARRKGGAGKQVRDGDIPTQGVRCRPWWYENGRDRLGYMGPTRFSHVGASKKLQALRLHQGR
jgi:hypothetical protein